MNYQSNNLEDMMISVILPTYNEAGNIEPLVLQIYNIFLEMGMRGEIIIVDDDSPDGTSLIAQSLAKQYPVRVCVRRHERGLSKAVMKGLEMAEGDICVVMDADQSHPVQKIPEMIHPIREDKCDMTIGSRYVRGGGWETQSYFREAASRIAGSLARGVTNISDPTSGFMAVRKNILNGVFLNPLGWKIALEIAVKVNPRIEEIPILFSERGTGKSKFGLKSQWEYLRHLLRLYLYRYL